MEMSRIGVRAASQNSSSDCCRIGVPAASSLQCGRAMELAFGGDLGVHLHAFSGSLSSVWALLGYELVTSASSVPQPHSTFLSDAEHRFCDDLLQRRRLPDSLLFGGEGCDAVLQDSHHGGREFWQHEARAQSKEYRSQNDSQRDACTCNRAVHWCTLVICVIGHFDLKKPC